MFVEKHDMKLADSLNENALVELSAADVDEVAGGVAPLGFAAWWAARTLVEKVVIGGATAVVGGGGGFAAGYWANRH